MFSTSKSETPTSSLDRWALPKPSENPTKPLLSKKVAAAKKRSANKITSRISSNTESKRQKSNESIVMQKRAAVMTEQCQQPVDVVPDEKQSRHVDLEEYKRTFEEMRNQDQQAIKGEQFWKSIPTKAELMRKEFGRPDTKHSFTVEPMFEHIILLLLKSKMLQEIEVVSLRKLHPLYDHLHKTIARAESLDFRRITKTLLNYENQESIPMGKVMCFTAAAIHYDLHVSSVLRYAGGNYTADYRNVKEIVQNLKGKVDESDLEDLERVFTTGAPTKMVAESSNENYMDYLKYGNHKSILKDPAKVVKTMNKEDRNCYVIPMPCWLARFIPNAFFTPNGLLCKPGKKDRLVFDGSFLINWDSTPINTMIDIDTEPLVTYGRVLQEHLNRIWNLRISYPNEDILLWDDDVAGCFRHIKHHPDVVAAFGLKVESNLYFYVGQTFGSVFSPANQEPVRRAREKLARALFNDDSLTEKHKDLLDEIEMAAVAPKGTAFVKARKCSTNKGVLTEAGTPVNTPINTFVDDALMAEIRSRIRQAMAASIESLFMILGEPDERKRRIALSLDKFFDAICGPEKVQLGLQFDTRAMVVKLTETMREKMLAEIKNWHDSRKAFTALQAARLVGTLQYMASISQWAKFLYSSLSHSVIYALSKNKVILEKSSGAFKDLSTQLRHAEQRNNACKAAFYQGKIARLIWNKKDKSYIVPTMRQELKLLTTLLENPEKYKWESPIAHLAEKDPDSTTYGDACLYGGGGFSTDLGFWWQVEWPEEIQNRTLKVLKNNKSGELISINALEYLVVIINYAAATACYENRRTNSKEDIEYPTILNMVDNTTADSWTHKMCKKSKSGKALALVLSSIMINNPVGLNSRYLEGDLNDIADAISRVFKSDNLFDFNKLMQDYPQLRSCRRFHPSKELLSKLYAAVSSASASPVDPPKTLGRFDPVNSTL